MNFIVWLSLILYSIIAYADEVNQWDLIREKGLQPGVTYNISSGSGFFVDNNYVVTNEHVVEDCLTISLRGSVDPATATLVNVDKDHDLALLKTDIVPKSIAYLRSDDGGLKIEDNLHIIGYPLEHSQDGQYTVVNVKLLSFDGLGTNSTQLEFTSGIEHGNSGGPVIDDRGNVVGVAQAKKKYFQVASQSENILPGSEPYKTDGIAIGLKTLKNFLDSNSIHYQTHDSGNNIMIFDQNNLPNNYIVNIHCVKK